MSAEIITLEGTYSTASVSPCATSVVTRTPSVWLYEMNSTFEIATPETLPIDSVRSWNSPDSRLGAVRSDAGSGILKSI